MKIAGVIIIVACAIFLGYLLIKVLLRILDALDNGGSEEELSNKTNNNESESESHTMLKLKSLYDEVNSQQTNNSFTKCIGCSATCGVSSCAETCYMSCVTREASNSISDLTSGTKLINED